MADVRGSETIAAFGLKSRRRAASWWLMGLSLLAVIACVVWGVDERRSHQADLAAAAHSNAAQVQTAAVSPPP